MLKWIGGRDCEARKHAYGEAPPELKPTVLAVAELEQKAREVKAQAK